MDFFSELRKFIVGIDHQILTPYGTKPLIYLDWTASGRLFHPIEEKMLHVVGPMVANTHTEANSTGSFTTKAYHDALCIIKKHVHAGKGDVVLTDGSGTTGVIAKFQRLLGLKVPENFQSHIQLDEKNKPVVFITHMEHHSNHTSWLETICDVVVMKPNANGEIDPELLNQLLHEYGDRQLKIGSFTACSNVSGVITPYHALAKIMHEHNGYCFVDFAASAPYVDIDMHPHDPMEKLDAVFFSPHKFLGGPGSSGVVVFDSCLYVNEVPDQPGGGTVLWTNPWGGRRYYEDIETREDGGTPPFLQTIRAALSITLKEHMLENGMLEREKQLLHHLFNGLKDIHGAVILEEEKENRLGIVSFYLKDIHYNLVVKLLDERFGIQVRGGCSCAGTYGHFLLGIQEQESKTITDQLDKGILSVKPGWVRVSIHPTNTIEEMDMFLHAIREIVQYHKEWAKEYIYHPECNEFYHRSHVNHSTSNLFKW